jgi:acetylornithine deacetylase/succinyl-diaminopimelate desuccinylase-like protein
MPADATEPPRLVRPDELAELAAIPAPTGAEGRRRAWLERRLAGLPGERAVDAAGNLIWRFGPGRPRLLVMAHMDTVFAEGTPLENHRDGDDLVGPGVGDNAAGVMVAVWVLEATAAAPPGLAVAFTVGEEGLGNLRGALHACAELAPQGALALEGHGLDRVVVDHVGSLRATVAVDGPGGHSWHDRGTPSATHAIARLATELIGPGVNVGTISGGRSVNAIADHAELLVERRGLDQGELDAFEAALGALAVEPPLALTRTIVGRRPAGGIDRDQPLLAAVREVRRRLGLPDELVAGSTDANAAHAHGIPALSIGCGQGGRVHTTEERIGIASLELGARQFAHVIRTATG